MLQVPIRALPLVFLALSSILTSAKAAALPSENMAPVEPFQVYRYYSKNIAKNETDEAFDKLKPMIATELEKYKPRTTYCTTRSNHNGTDPNNESGSQAIISCADGYQVILYNLRGVGSNSLNLPLDVRIFCFDALLIADETLQAAEGERAIYGPLVSTEKSERQVLGQSFWYGDVSWGILLVKADGCPAQDDKLKWVEFTEKEK
ncbi:hypothetical protein ABW19_dt0202855 [Dactylella cylindrospora]|nr:hypothetical protein ABW19_dt0202855 [Dactylella cylindrospora]